MDLCEFGAGRGLRFRTLVKQDKLSDSWLVRSVR